MGGRATGRVVRSIVAPAIGVPAAALAAGAVMLVVACNREPGSGPYPGPVGMVPAPPQDAQAIPPPGIMTSPTPTPPPTLTQPPGFVAAPTQSARPPGMVPAPTHPAIPGMPPAPVTGLPTQGAPPGAPPAGSGMLPGAAAGALASAPEPSRPTRAVRRATDRDGSAGFGALAGRCFTAGPTG